MRTATPRATPYCGWAQKPCATPGARRASWAGRGAAALAVRRRAARDPRAAGRGVAGGRARPCAVPLTAFAGGGSRIFRLADVRIGALKSAGGVVIVLTALDMVQDRRSQQRETPVEKA